MDRWSEMGMGYKKTNNWKIEEDGKHGVSRTRKVIQKLIKINKEGLRVLKLGINKDFCVETNLTVWNFTGKMGQS